MRNKSIQGPQALIPRVKMLSLSVTSPPILRPALSVNRLSKRQRKKKLPTVRNSCTSVTKDAFSCLKFRNCNLETVVLKTN